MGKNIGKIVAVISIYAAFAIYLYRPHSQIFPLTFLQAGCHILAGLGCFVLSRRWVSSFAGSFFAGAFYGFGAFSIGLGVYHPFAGLVFAALPWLFCPAAFWPRRMNRFAKITSALLCVLPFLAVILFFQAGTVFRFFPIPIQEKLTPANMIGLISLPAMKNGSQAFVSFYHVGLAPLVMGLFMFFAAHRIGVTMIFTAGTLLAFWDSVFQVSPVFWVSVPVLFCSVIIGVGIQALACASRNDERWVLASMAIMTVLGAVTFVMGITWTNAFFESAKMYTLAVLTVSIIFFLTHANLRLRWLRWAVLCTALGVDMIINARIFVDRIF